MKAESPHTKPFHLRPTIEDYDKLLQSIKESTEQCSQLLLDKLNLEYEIINLKARLSKYENINKLKK